MDGACDEMRGGAGGSTCASLARGGFAAVPFDAVAVAESPFQALDVDPPRDREDIKRSFFNRETEIRRAKRSLLDSSVWRKRNVWVCHGATRVGKSHLMLRILHDDEVARVIPEVFVVQANNTNTAAAALRDTLQVVGDRVFELQPRGQLSPTALSSLKERLLTVYGLLGLPTPDRRLTPGTPPGLSNGELVATIHDALRAFVAANEAKPVALFVDDIDMLQAGGPEGGEESNVLVRALDPLADGAGVLPIVATRGAFFAGHHKNLFDFLPVNLLSFDVIAAIHAHRVSALHGGRPVFSEDTVLHLAKRTNGRVGMFQRFCYDLWADAGDDLPIGLDTLRLHLLRQLNFWRSGFETRDTVEQVLAALRDRRFEIDPVADPRNNGLHLTLLEPIPNSRTREGRERYTISELYLDVLRDIVREV